MHFLMGRQAILDRNGKTFGYELLYREQIRKNASDMSVDGNTATNRVILNAFINLGMDKIAKTGRVFINFTKDLIVEKVYEALPKDKVIVEILEDVMAESEVVESLEHAKKMGYTIALDDFVFLDHLEKLVALADIIKIDFIELSRDEIRQQVESYKPYKLKLLAEKVENNDEYQFALDLGFDYFQGYFFQKPTIEMKSDIAPYQSTIIRALGIVNSPSSDINELIELIKGDLYLHTKLLAYINSPYFGLKHHITSIKSAVTLLGFLKIKEWLTIMYVSKLAEDKPEELVILSTTRAKFASLLAKSFSLDENNAYLMGMFSLMESILNMPMQVILEDFDYIDEDVKKALLNQDSKYKILLDFVKLFENAQFDEVQNIIDRIGINAAKVNQFYMESIEFADSIYRS